MSRPKLDTLEIAITELTDNMDLCLKKLLENVGVKVQAPPMGFNGKKSKKGFSSPSDRIAALQQRVIACREKSCGCRGLYPQ